MSMSNVPLEKVVSKLVSNPVKKAVKSLSEKYNFEVEEALRWLSEGVKSEKSKDLAPPLSKVEKVSEKAKYPMPFDGLKKENCCNGIVKNHGLYTQCSKKVKGFCKGCADEPYGNIDDRVKAGLYEYKDPKGKGPKRYTEVLKKLKLSKETVEEEAKRLNIELNAIHFEEVVQENVKRGRPKSEKKVKEVSSKKGRPKKEKKTVELSKDVEEEDLFATLIAKANGQHQPLEKVEPNPVEEVESNPVEDVIVEEIEPDPVEDVIVDVIVEESKDLAPPLSKVEKKSKKVKEADPAKEAEKLKKAEEKAAKEAEKLKKAEEKAAKEAEKLKKAEEKAAKESEKLKKAEEKAAKVDKKKSKDLAAPLLNVDEEADVVKKFDFEGKSYYKSKKSGVIYNMEQEVVGKWNEALNEIDFDEEEEEEEYDD